MIVGRGRSVIRPKTSAPSELLINKLIIQRVHMVAGFIISGVLYANITMERLFGVLLLVGLVGAQNIPLPPTCIMDSKYMVDFEMTSLENVEWRTHVTYETNRKFELCFYTHHLEHTGPCQYAPTAPTNISLPPKTYVLTLGLDTLYAAVFWDSPGWLFEIADRATFKSTLYDDKHVVVSRTNNLNCNSSYTVSSHTLKKNSESSVNVILLVEILVPVVVSVVIVVIVYKRKRRDPTEDEVPLIL